MMQKEPQKRKNLRLENYDYAQAGCYFVTLCVKDGHEMLGKIDAGATVPGRPQHIRINCKLSDIGKVVDSAILHNNRNGVKVDHYVIMPNHIHMIIAIQPEAGDRGRSPLQMIIRNLKAYVTKQIGFSIWQKFFHDHIIRNEAEYQKIWQYIDKNSEKWQEDCYYPAKKAELDNKGGVAL